MAFQSIDQDKILAEFFTDVVHLRDVFKEAVATPTLDKRLLVIHGVGGVGKSSLLRMFRLHCKGMNVPIALASGDEAKSAFDILVRWIDDLTADRMTFPAFSKTYQRYREIQAKVDTQTKKAGGRTADIASKAASKTAEAASGALVGAAMGSVVPGIGTAVGAALGSAVGGMGAEALTDWLRGFLKQPDIDLLLDPTQKLTSDFLGDMIKAANKRRLVLMLDTFEQMTALEDWAREVAQHLPTNVLFVIAGRALPNWGRAWESWQKYAYIEELKPMTEGVMRELIQHYYATMRGGAPDPLQVEAIICFARGLPMVVTSAVQLWVEYGVEDFQSVKAEIGANLVDRLMEGVPNTLIPALEAAASVRWFDQPILRAVMQQDDVRDVYNELRRFPFVRTRVEGLAVHDVVREIIDVNLRSQDAERFCILHERAAAYFEKRLEKGEEVERLELEHLYHQIQTNEQAGVTLFQEMAETLTRYRLVNRLRTLLKDVNTYTLERENSKLWRAYYAARLAELEERLTDALTEYEAIDRAQHVEPKLRAYALCDLGFILTRREFLLKDPSGQRAKSALEKSLNLGISVDLKLFNSFWALGDLYRRLNDLEDGMPNYQRAIQSVEQLGDQYTATRLKQDIVIKLIFHGRFGAISGYSKLTSEMSQIYATYPLLAIEFGEAIAVPSVWMGRYAQIEKDLGILLKELTKLSQFDYWQEERRALVLRALCYAAGMQGKEAVARKHFDDLMQMIESGRVRRDSVFKSLAFAFYGNVEMRMGHLDHAGGLLQSALDIRRAIDDVTGMPENLTWLGDLCHLKAKQVFDDHEAKDLMNAALSYYYPTAKYPWKTRPYFLCGALTGLVRVKHAQGDYSAIPPLLAEAEQLAQQYEYNDHFASLRLTQGHIAWEGNAPTWDNGLAAALSFYQHALIYALRYNRFLLDEVLSGRPQGTPLRPIIPQSLEHSEEGRQMLTALRDWWQTGVNDIGTPRPDTISPLPEGVPLLEAERIAREREPGDGSLQKYVIEQIDAALA